MGKTGKRIKDRRRRQKAAREANLERIESGQVNSEKAQPAPRWGFHYHLEHLGK